MDAPVSHPHHASHRGGEAAEYGSDAAGFPLLDEQYRAGQIPGCLLGTADSGGVQPDVYLRGGGLWKAVYRRNSGGIPGSGAAGVRVHCA